VNIKSIYSQLRTSVIALTIFVLGYSIGTYSFAHQLWPINTIIAAQNRSTELKLKGNFDNLGGYSNLQNKVEVSCPKQDSSTIVILAIGQSNSANHAEKKFSTQFPKRVVNYYLGKCFTAESPLLGASGDEGEYLTPMADLLIANRSASQVVILSKSIGQSTISDWIKGGKLMSELVSTLHSFSTKYEVTHVVWHQGESDFMKGTTSREYYDSFITLHNLLVAEKVHAPVYSFISTKCGYNPKWIPDNNISIAMRQLINDGVARLAVDTDLILLPEDRRPQSPSQEPNCHLSKGGQVKIAKLLANRL